MQDLLTVRWKRVVMVVAFVRKESLETRVRPKV